MRNAHKTRPTGFTKARISLYEPSDSESADSESEATDKSISGTLRQSEPEINEQAREALFQYEIQKNAEQFVKKLKSNAKAKIQLDTQSGDQHSKGGGEAEVDSANNLDQNEENLIAGIVNENRDFIRVEVAGVEYKALYDSGAQITIVGPKLANAFRDRLKGAQTCLKMPLTPVTSKTLGYLDVTVEIDGQYKAMRWRAADYLDEEIMLGADFKNLWQLDSSTSEQEWRVEKGPWHSFWAEDGSDQTAVFVECAGLETMTESEQAKLQAVVEETPFQQHDPKMAGVATLFPDPCENTEPIEKRTGIPMRTFSGGSARLTRCGGISALDSSQQAQVDQLIGRLIKEHRAGKLGMTPLVTHKIDVQGAEPIKHQTRRMSLCTLQAIQEEVRRLEKEDVIEESHSPWTASPVLVEKEDSSKLLGIDYRNVNKFTKKDAYPTKI